MGTEEKNTKPHYGVADFDRRTYQRYPIRLPIEYFRTDSSINQNGQTFDVSEGGLQVLLPEPLEVGQNLRLKLFFSSDSGLTMVEMLASVVWINRHPGEGNDHYRSGVKFINISPEDKNKLKTISDFLSYSH